MLPPQNRGPLGLTEGKPKSVGWGFDCLLNEWSVGTPVLGRKMEKGGWLEQWGNTKSKVMCNLLKVTLTNAYRQGKGIKS